jgi:hypothetical protein
MGLFTIIAAIIAVATSAASYMQAKKAEKMAAKQAEEMAAVQLSGHNSNRSLYTVYGEALVGSTTVYKRISGRRVPLSLSNFLIKTRATGADLTSTESKTAKRYFYRVVTLCNGPVEDITNILVDGEGFRSPRFGYDHNFHFGSAISKGPTAGQHYSRLANYSEFFQWDNTKTGKGVAYAVERLYLDKNHPAFQGEPSTQYLVKGRLLYDPRLDSTVTGGSGSHRQATPSTWVWTDNPAICLLDYITNTEYGRGLAYSTIDLAAIMTAANACDVLVDVPARLINEEDAAITLADILDGEYEVNVPVGDVIPIYRPNQAANNKQKRYRINTAIDGAKEVLDNIQQILNVFKANLVYVNGKYTVTMADVASSVLSLGDDDIIGGLNISDGDRAQRMNRATIKFTNANKNYKTDQVSWPEIGSTAYNAYLAEDQDEKIHRTFTIDGCTDLYQAEDTAEFIVRDGRVGLTVGGTFGSRALALIPGDVVALTYDSASYAGKYFRVQTVALNLQTMNVALSLREYDSSVYTWNASRGNEPLGLNWDTEPVNLSPTSPTFGTIVTSVITQADGSAISMLEVPFSGVPDQASKVEISWSVQNANNYNTISITDLANETSAKFPVGLSGVTYDVRLRYVLVSVTGTSMPSAYVYTTIAVPGLASPTGTKVDGMDEGATATVIYRQTTAPSGTAHNTGDQWFDTDNGNKHYVWDGSNWASVQDTAITTAIQNAAASQEAADGKIDSFYQNDAPSTASEGDLWFDTNDGNKIYTRRSGAWVVTQDSAIGTALQDAADADAKADGKVTTFYQNDAPTAEGIGDLWVDTNDGNKLYRWSGSAWVSVQDTAIATAQQEAEVKYASFFRVTIASGTSVAAPSDSAFTTQFGRAPIEHDQLVVTNTATTPDTQAAYVRGSSAWGAAVDNFMSGDLIVDGSIGADHITVTSLSTINANMGTITTGNLHGGNVAGITINATKLYEGAGTYEGSTTGFYLGSDGKFSLSDKLSFDASATDPVLSITGNLTANSVTVGTGADSVTMAGGAPVSSGVAKRLFTGVDGGENTFVVSSDGHVEARNFSLYDSGDNLIYTTVGGFQPLALTQIASSTEGVKVTTYSEALDNDSDEVEIVVSQTSNVTVKVIKTVSSWTGVGESTSSEAAAISIAKAQLVDSFDMMIRYHTSSGFTVTQGTLASAATSGAANYTRFTQATDYVKDGMLWFYDPEGNGQWRARANVRTNHLDVSASGQVVLSATISSLAAGTYYFKTFMRTTDGSGYNTASIKVGSTNSRTFEITDNTSDGGFVVDGGAAQTVGAADITSVNITTAANGGLTGGSNQTSGAANFTLAVNQNQSLNNVTLGGYLRGPSTFTIDPAAHGNDTGTVVIAGNLQVDGTTTTINSTTVDVDDLNITVAKGAANAAAANTGGLTVDGANAELKYIAVGDKWTMNKPLEVSSHIVASSFSGPIFGAASGAPDSTIWAISRDSYPTYGIFYDEGDPDKILYKWNGATKFNINMETGALDTPSTVTASGGNSGNWNTAYTYSQVGHLALAGGTLTGVLTINNTADNQILLTSPSAWTGIGFNDSGSNGTQYIWHNGIYGTFAIGGGGSNVVNKKLHVDGGMTVGSTYDATAVDANSLKVQGTIESAGNIGAGGVAVSGYALYARGSITQDSGSMLAFGNVVAGTGYVKANSGGSGGYYVASQQVIDGGRNLTNIGTFNGYNPQLKTIGANSAVSGSGFKRVAVRTGSAGRGAFTYRAWTTGGNVVPVELIIEGHADWSSGETIHTAKAGAGAYWTQVRIVRESGNAYLEINFSQALTYLSSELQQVGQAGFTLLTGTLASATGTESHLGETTTVSAGVNTQNYFNSMGGYKVGGATTIDLSRNLTAVAGTFTGNVNITTGSVAIGMTGTATSLLDIRGSGNADVMSKIINTGQTSNGRKTEFLFGKDNGPNLSGALRYVYDGTQANRKIELMHYGTTNGLSIADGGSATFSGTISSGAMTVSDSILVSYSGNDGAGRDAGLKIQNDGTDWGAYIRKASAAQYGLRIDSAGSLALAIYSSEGGSTLTFGVNGSTGALSSGIISATGGTSTQWNTAYSWGNPSGTYLALSGGTLTGGLTGTTGTFSGKIKTSGGELEFTSHNHQITTGNSNNIKLKIGTTGAAGVALADSNNSLLLQVYGDSSGYGFLNSEWGSWNLRKSLTGALYLNNNNTYYIQPESTSNLNDVQAQSYKIGTTPVIDGSRNVIVGGNLHFNGATDSSFIGPVSSTIRYGADGIHQFDTYNGGWGTRAQITDTNLNLGASVGFQMNGTTVIDASSNITAGTITSKTFKGGELGNPQITRNGLTYYVDFNNKACISGTSSTEVPVDLGPNNYLMSLYGGANFEYKDGIGCYYFDGSADHIEINNFVVADASNSVEIWHYAVAHNGWETWWDSGTERPLLGTYNGSLRAYPNGTSLATITTGKWYHVVWAWATNADLDVFVNGVRVAEAVNWGHVQRTGTFQAWLGGDTTSETTNGYIAIARAYDRQLTAADVLQNYNAEVGTFATVTPDLGLIQKGGSVTVPSLQVGSTTVIDSARRILAADGAQNVPYITFAADTDTGLYRPASDVLGFSTAASERMRLNDSGDWMVSNTVANVASNYSAQAGCGWVDSDTHFEIATTSNRAPLEIGKNNANDGTLIVLRKQGNISGSIGTYGGTPYLSAGTAGGVRFTYLNSTNAAMFPCNTTGVNSDNTHDIGHTSVRFRDLYLSGVVNAGTISSGAITSTGNSTHGGYSSWTAGNGTGGILMHYNSSNSYRGYFDWRTLQLGNNGANNIIAGNTSTGGHLKFWVNATSISQSGGTSGINALTISAAGNSTFSGSIDSGAITSSGAVTATGIDSQQHRLLQGTVTAGGLFKERTISGAGVSNDVSIFAESINDGGEIHLMTGGSATKKFTFTSAGNFQISSTDVIDASRNATFANVTAVGSGGTPFSFTGSNVNIDFIFGSTAQSQYSNLIIKSNSGQAQLWKAGTGYTSWGGASALNIYNSAGNLSFHPSGTANVLQLTSTSIYASKPIVMSGTTVIDISRNITGAEVAASTRLYLNGGNYEGQIVFGTTDAWRCGIRQHDDGDAELRIWAKNANGRVHIATGYDGQPTSITKPTDGFVVDHNNVGIGNFSATDPSEKLHVKGNILASGNVTAYSDERLKSDIQTLDGSKVLQMRGVSFTKDGEFGSGVIAQELEKIAPELVHDGEYKSVAYGNITGYLIEAVKEQQKEIDELKSLVKQLLEK